MLSHYLNNYPTDTLRIVHIRFLERIPIRLKLHTLCSRKANTRFDALVAIRVARYTPDQECHSNATYNPLSIHHAFLPISSMASTEIAKCLSDTLSPDSNVRIAAELKLSAISASSGAYTLFLYVHQVWLLVFNIPSLDVPFIFRTQRRGIGVFKFDSCSRCSGWIAPDEFFLSHLCV